MCPQALASITHTHHFPFRLSHYLALLVQNPHGWNVCTTLYPCLDLVVLIGHLQSIKEFLFIQSTVGTFLCVERTEGGGLLPQVFVLMCII